MLSFIKNLNVATKMFIAPVIFFISMVIVGVLALSSLFGINDKVMSISDDLADDAITANKLLDEIYQKRLSMKNYLQTDNPEFLDKFYVKQKSMSELLDIAHREIRAPARQKIVKELSSLNTEYDNLFKSNVVPSKTKQQSLFSNDFTGNGKVAREALSEIMTTAFNDSDRVAAYHAGVAQKHLLLSRLYTSKFLVTEKQSDLDRGIKEVDLTLKSMQVLQSEIQNPQRILLLEAALTNTNSLQGIIAQMSETVKTRRTAVERMDEVGPIIASLSGELANSVVSSIGEQSGIIRETVIATKWSIITLIVVSLVICSILSWVIVSLITKPIKQTSAMLSDIANGNGDLTKRLDVDQTDEVGELCRHFNEFANKTELMIKDIASATDQLGAAAEELSLVSKQTNEGVQGQEEAIVEINSANQLVIESLNQVNEQIVEASETADGTAHEADQVMNSMKQTVDTISLLAEDIEASNQLVTELQSESDNIGRILDLITGITEQINLLALNAAIEAARAGEAGRGFAVVADEVRTLASKTQESAEEIFNSVNSLTSIVKKTSTSLTKNKENASLSVDRAIDAQTNVENIGERVVRIKACNDGITSATSEQDRAYQSVTDRLTQISAVVCQTKESSSQSTNASDELAKLSAQLQSIVGQFKVA